MSTYPDPGLTTNETVLWHIRKAQDAAEALGTLAPDALTRNLSDAADNAELAIEKDKAATQLLLDAVEFNAGDWAPPDTAPEPVEGFTTAAQGVTNYLNRITKEDNR